MQELSIQDLSIVLVEPSKVQAQIICGHLEGAQAGDVHWLASGAEAPDYLRQFPPDLVISAMH